MPYFDYNRTPEAIIHACQERSHEIYQFKRNTNIYRNQDLQAFFADTDVLRIDELTPRMQEMKADDHYSEAFEAKRAGELIRWGTDHGVLVREIVDRVVAWRLVDREMQYLLVGPAARQREIRIRGLRDPVERAEANKLFNREIKRQAKAKAKDVARYRQDITANIDTLMRLSPEMLLPDSLERFRVADHPYLGNYRDVLIDASADEDGYEVSKVLAVAALDAVMASAAARKAKAEAPVISENDADAMGSINF